MTLGSTSNYFNSLRIENLVYVGDLIFLHLRYHGEKWVVNTSVLCYVKGHQKSYLYGMEGLTYSKGILYQLTGHLINVSHVSFCQFPHMYKTDR